MVARADYFETLHSIKAKRFPTRIQSSKGSAASLDLQGSTGRASGRGRVLGDVGGHCPAQQAAPGSLIEKNKIIDHC